MRFEETNDSAVNIYILSVSSLKTTPTYCRAIPAPLTLTLLMWFMGILLLTFRTTCNIVQDPKVTMCYSVENSNLIHSIIEKSLNFFDSNKVLIFHDILVFKAFYFVKKIIKSKMTLYRFCLKRQE